MFGNPHLHAQEKHWNLQRDPNIHAITNAKIGRQDPQVSAGDLEFKAQEEQTKIDINTVYKPISKKTSTQRAKICSIKLGSTWLYLAGILKSTEQHIRTEFLHGTDQSLP